ncbi:hypothetical protein [Pseudomonas sp. UFMG81]|uniref:hypothetical protein n=1 Tax=Pseudomonas sp. UFMG81 TaxID=2745936 RepID=UPI00188E54E9|nr:hypothetical protein [Pseudomonas sp. UFMG81]
MTIYEKQGLVEADSVSPESQGIVQKNENYSSTGPTLEEQKKLAAKIDAIREESNEKLKSKSKVSGSFSFFGINANEEPVAPDFQFVGTLPNIDDGRFNTVPAAAFLVEPDGNNYISITMPLWDPTVPDAEAGDYAGSNDVVRLYRREYSVDEGGEVTYIEVPYSEVLFSTPFPPDPNAFPNGVSFTLEPKFLEWFPREGQYDIFYRVSNDALRNTSVSPLQPLYIDLRPPSYRVTPAALNLPADVPEPGIITKAMLEARPIFEFPVPLATLAAKEDRIVVRERRTNTIVHTALMWPADQDEPNPTADVPSAQLQALGEGVKELVYELIDRAGWASTVSFARPLTLRLENVPIDPLPPPIVTVPRVNREVARAGLQISLPVIPNALPTDRISMSLHHPDRPGNPVVLPEFTVGAGSTTASWEHLAVPDGQANYLLRITYSLMRGTTTVGPSLPHTVPVDLRTVGPVPGDEGPVNDALVPIVVRGTVSQQDNLITEADANDDAGITFTYYTEVGAGHVIKFFYDGKELAEVLTLVGNEAGTKSVVLPRDVFLESGNGQKQAYYEVYPDNTSESAGNYQRSPITVVTVRAVTFPIPVNLFVRYPYLSQNAQQNQRPGAVVNQTGVINCAARPWNGVQLRVNWMRSEDGWVVVGDVVTIRLQYATSTRATAETFVNQFYSFEHRVSQADLNGRAINHTVPYLAIRFFNRGAEQPQDPLGGSFVSSFTVTKADESIGRSTECMVRWGVSLVGGVRCDNWGQ